MHLPRESQEDLGWKDPMDILMPEILIVLKWDQVDRFRKSSRQFGDFTSSLGPCFRFELLLLWKVFSLHPFWIYLAIAWDCCPLSFQCALLGGVWLSLLLYLPSGRIITQHHNLHIHPLILVSNSAAEISKKHSLSLHIVFTLQAPNDSFSSLELVFSCLSLTSLLTWHCLISISTCSSNEHRGNFRLKQSKEHFHKLVIL